MTEDLESFRERVSEMVDARLLEAESRIFDRVRIWLGSGILAMIAAMGIGFGSLLFAVGKTTAKFDELLEASREQQKLNRMSAAWMRRKDLIDSTMINHLEPRGYKPPSGHGVSDLEDVGL
jgi:hypothetical protein